MNTHILNNNLPIQFQSCVVGLNSLYCDKCRKVSTHIVTHTKTHTQKDTHTYTKGRVLDSCN